MKPRWVLSKSLQNGSEKGTAVICYSGQGAEQWSRIENIKNVLRSLRKDLFLGSVQSTQTTSSERVL